MCKSNEFNFKLLKPIQYTLLAISQNKNYLKNYQLPMTIYDNYVLINLKFYLQK